MRFAALLAAVIALMAGFAFAAETPPPAPAAATTQALAKVVASTRAKLDAGSASWKVLVDAPGQQVLTVSMLSASGRSRFVLSTEAGAGGQSVELARIIQRDGLWYVDENDPEAPPAKYRPLEAPFRHPVIEFCRQVSRPWFIDVSANPVFTAMKGPVASFMVALPAADRENAQRSIAQLNDAIRQFPDLANNEKFQQNLKNLRQVLDEGVPIECDTTTGILVEHWVNQRRIRVMDFQFLPAAATEKELDVAQKQWADHSLDFTASSKAEDRMLFMHSFSAAQDGKRPSDTDLAMLDIQSGEIRRIPFRGLEAVPGCFLRDRKSVLVSGADEMGVPGLFKVNLSTGVTTRVGNELLSKGFPLRPCVSPDGNSVLVFQMLGTAKMLKGQILMVDLPSGQTRVLGQPEAVAFPRWLPDGKAVLFSRPILDAKGFVEDGTICRMDLQGKVTEICAGRIATVLGSRMLFWGKDKLWRTCDLDGKNERLLGDGLKGCSDPSASPDGKRVVMTRSQGPGGGQEPVIVTVSDGSIQPMHTRGGYWDTPVWE